MALGVPLIVSSTKIDRHYFDDNLVEFFASGNERDLADKMLRLYRDKARREQLAANGKAFAGINNWDRKKHGYFSLIESL
jgi:glycosyltransferase involved in cell wall biosynthesis